MLIKLLSRMEYFFTVSQILVEGKRIRRDQSKKADYLLLKNGIILRSRGFSRLWITLKFYMYLLSNGKYFVEHDFRTGKEKIILTSDHCDIFKKVKPRYYQRIAIDKTVQVVVAGLKRILLVMTTDTGKTFTAFQIAFHVFMSLYHQPAGYEGDEPVRQFNPEFFNWVRVD